MEGNRGQRGATFVMLFAFVRCYAVADTINYISASIKRLGLVRRDETNSRLLLRPSTFLGLYGGTDMSERKQYGDKAIFTGDDLDSLFSRYSHHTLKAYRDQFIEIWKNYESNEDIINAKFESWLQFYRGLDCSTVRFSNDKSKKEHVNTQIQQKINDEKNTMSMIGKVIYETKDDDAENPKVLVDKMIYGKLIGGLLDCLYVHIDLLNEDTDFSVDNQLKMWGTEASDKMRGLFDSNKVLHTIIGMRSESITKYKNKQNVKKRHKKDEKERAPFKQKAIDAWLAGDPETGRHWGQMSDCSHFVGFDPDFKDIRERTIYNWIREYVANTRKRPH